jgi:hypothetical protein
MWNRLLRAGRRLAEALEPESDAPATDTRHKHIRGARVWAPRTPRRYSEELQRQILTWERQLGGDPVRPGLRLYGRAGLTRHQEVQHLGLIGATGAGKTQIGAMLTEQAIERRDLVVAVDAKGDLTSWLLSTFPAASQVIAPWDTRSPSWVLSDDVRTRLDAEEFALALIPHAAEGRDKFWTVAARTIVETLTLHLTSEEKAWSFADLWTWVARGPEEVSTYLARSSEGRVFLPLLTGKARRASVEDIWTTVLAFLGPLRHLAAAWPVPHDDASRWSVTRWLARRASQVIVLPLPSAYAVLGRTAARLVLDRVGSQLLMLPDSVDRRIVFFLDEFSSLGEMGTVKELLVRARSKGAVCIVCLQDVGSLQAAWGRDEASSLLNALGTLIALRTSDPDLSEWVARALGRRELEERRSLESHHYGRDDAVSRFEQVHTREEWAIMPSELSQLRPLTGFVRAPGWPLICAMSWRYTNRSGAAPAVVEADWVSQPVHFDAGGVAAVERRPQAPEHALPHEPLAAWDDLEHGGR